MGFAVVCNVHRHWQVQVLLLDTAVADALPSVSQPVLLMVQLDRLGLGGLEVKRQLIVCT